MANDKIPKFDELINPLFKALKRLGGSGTNEEIYEEVVKSLNLPDEILDIPHLGSYSQSEVQYRLAWAKTWLKKYGAIKNTSRGIWVINSEFAKVNEVDPREVTKKVKSFEKNVYGAEQSSIDVSEENILWRERLRKVLTSMEPDAFERLSRLLLRESGITNVEVTGKSGDGGIDGTGQLKIHGLISFKMVFQCKRYSGSVASNQIRDFRGSITADVEKGLFITTGTFTRDAIKESSGPGKKTIDLVDGDELIDKLAELELGLKPIKAYEIDEEFFRNV